MGKEGVKLYAMDMQWFPDNTYFQECYRQLSASRRAKIDGYHFLKDKKLSLGAGILLDSGLREYGLREADVKIELKENGKPYLPDYPQIHFNVTHSENMVLAVFADKEVGCDIEYTKEADLELAKRFFCPEEYEFIAGLEGERKDNAFFQIWTLKESFLKATGMGLALPLNAFGLYMSGGKIMVRQDYDEFGYGILQYNFGRYWAAVCIQSYLKED